MELFDEVKNRYFHIVFRVLSECRDGLSKKDIIKIIDEEEFQEKVIGKDFQTFEGLLLNEYEENENYNLIKEKSGLFYPAIEADKKASVPVRFTNIEKAWLKNLLEEPSVSIILRKDTIDKLKEALKNFQCPNTSQLIETTNKSILPELKQYEDNFRILLKSIMEEKSIRY